MWSTLILQPNPTTEFEAWSRFVTITDYLISHLLGTNLGIILLIFGVISLRAYLAKRGHSGHLGLMAMVITIAANALGLMSASGWSTFAAPAIGWAYLAGMEDAMRIDVGADFIVIFMLVIALSFIGNVLLGIAIWRSGILPKMGWRHLDSLGSRVLRSRCPVWIFIYKQQLTDTAYRLFAYGFKRGWIVWSDLRRPPPALQQQEA
jgi:hypothetical protein